MKISNELKVGLTIIITAILFIIGVRFFEDLPLFAGTHSFESDFENASGLISGNTVRVNGVRVGSVDDVSIDAETGRVRVTFHVDPTIPVTEGSFTRITGIDALGAVRVELHLGDASGNRLAEGAFIPSRQGNDVVGDLTRRAPEIASQIDSVLASLDYTLGATGSLLAPGGDISSTLSGISESVKTLEELLRGERDHITGILENTEDLTGNLGRMTASGADSLGQFVSNLNGLLSRLDSNLLALEATTEGLTTLVDKLNGTDGTMGLLINDPGLYNRLDSTVGSLNSLLLDFRANPGRYLKEMRLVDLF